MSHEDSKPIAAYSYVTLRRGKVHKTVEMGVKEGFPDVLIDVAEDGSVIGVEILTAGKICGCFTEEGGN